jgi:hypothetical protein
MAKRWGKKVDVGGGRKVLERASFGLLSSLVDLLEDAPQQTDQRSEFGTMKEVGRRMLSAMR